MRKLTKFILIAFFVFFLSIPLYAEGGGKRAINRRVATNTGYTGVKGTFKVSIENVQIPTVSTELSSYFVGLNPNVYRDAPTFYVGSTPNEVDAHGIPYVTGWGAFINHNGNFTPKAYVDGEWGGIHVSDSSFDLKYYIDENEGSVWLQTNALGQTSSSPFPFPTDPQGYKNVSDPTNHPFFPEASDAQTGIYSVFGNVKVKRVVGMTQGAGPGESQNNFEYALDGSIITATYTAGFVHVAGANPDTWTHWTPSIIDQAITGYDVEQNEKDAQWNHHDTLKSQYILTFPNIDAAGNLSEEEAREEARTDSHQSRISTEGSNSRYVHETVKISLRSATKMTGGKSEPRQASSK